MRELLSHTTKGTFHRRVLCSYTMTASPLLSTTTTTTTTAAAAATAAFTTTRERRAPRGSATTRRCGGGGEGSSRRVGGAKISTISTTHLVGGGGKSCCVVAASRTQRRPATSAVAAAAAGGGAAASDDDGDDVITAATARRFGDILTTLQATPRDELPAAVKSVREELTVRFYEFAAARVESLAAAGKVVVHVSLVYSPLDFQKEARFTRGIRRRCSVTVRRLVAVGGLTRIADE